MKYLPHFKVIRTSSAGQMTVMSFLVRIGLLPFASLVLVYSVQVIVIPKFPIHGRLRDKCLRLS